MTRGAHMRAAASTPARATVTPYSHTSTLQDENAHTKENCAGTGCRHTLTRALTHLHTNVLTHSLIITLCRDTRLISFTHTQIHRCIISDNDDLMANDADTHACKHASASWQCTGTDEAEWSREFASTHQRSAIAKVEQLRVCVEVEDTVRGTIHREERGRSSDCCCVRAFVLAFIAAYLMRRSVSLFALYVPHLHTVSA
jgi:hypothetical protein